jgi:hypothetical protein
MLKLDDFFGIMLDDERSDLGTIFSAFKVEKMINGTNVVKKLSRSNGADSPIVGVAKRQQFLKMLKPLLNEDMIEYDSNYYSKEVNTSSDRDRQYGSEDKLLQVALIVASTKSLKMLENEEKIVNIKQLRDAAFLETRFDRLWEILSQETHHVVKAFRKAKK